MFFIANLSAYCVMLRENVCICLLQSWVKRTVLEIASQYVRLSLWRLRSFEQQHRMSDISAPYAIRRMCIRRAATIYSRAVSSTVLGSCVMHLPGYLLPPSCVPPALCATSGLRVEQLSAQKSPRQLLRAVGRRVEQPAESSADVLSSTPTRSPGEKRKDYRCTERPRWCAVFSLFPLSHPQMFL